MTPEHIHTSEENNNLSLREEADNLVPSESYDRAREFAKSGNYKDAIPFYLSFIDRSESVTDTQYSNLGFAYKKIGDYENARTFYERAYDIDSNNHITLQNIAYACKQLKDFESSKRYYEELIVLETSSANGKFPTAIDYSNYAGVLKQLDDADGAIAAYQTSLELNPENAITYSTYGNLLISIGDFSGAREALEKSRELNPDNYGVYNNLGLLSLRESEQLSGEEEIAKLQETRDFYETALSKKNNRISTEKLGEIDELLSQLEAEEIAKGIEK